MKSDERPSVHYNLQTYIHTHNNTPTNSTQAGVTIPGNTATVSREFVFNSVRCRIMKEHNQHKRVDQCEEDGSSSIRTHS